MSKYKFDNGTDDTNPFEFQLEMREHFNKQFEKKNPKINIALETNNVMVLMAYQKLINGR